MDLVALRGALGGTTSLATLATLCGQADRVRGTLERGAGALADTANEICAALERLAK